MISTAHAILRRVAEADFDPLWAIWSDPRVQAGLLNRPQTAEFRALFDTLLASETMWVVEDRASGDVIGRCGLFEFVPERQAEVAYLLHPDFWAAASRRRLRKLPSHTRSRIVAGRACLRLCCRTMLHRSRC